MGTGKTYTLKPGSSANFTIYGKIMSQPQSGRPANVISVPGTLAIDTMGTIQTSRVVLPYLEFYSYAAGTHEVAVTDGNFNIVMVRGGIYRLNRR